MNALVLDCVGMIIFLEDCAGSVRMHKFMICDGVGIGWYTINCDCMLSRQKIMKIVLIALECAS